MLAEIFVQLVLLVCFQQEPEEIQPADVVTLCHKLNFMGINRVVYRPDALAWQLYGEDAEAMLAWSQALEEKLQKVDLKNVRLFTQTIRDDVGARIKA